MKRLKVEFARPHETAWWLPAGLCAALLLAAARQGEEAWSTHKRAAVVEREAAALTVQLEAAMQAQRGAMESLARLPLYANDAAALAKMASFPVDRVFTALESTQVEGVKLTAIEITAHDGEVRVNLEFAEYAMLLRYLEEINAGEPTPRWALLQAQITQYATIPNSGVIVSRWTEAGR